MTLTEFVLARIAEDEEGARAAEDNWYGMLVNCIDNAPGEHINRHDPARVLADVEAKRRIVELHRVMPWQLSDGGYSYVTGGDGRRWDQFYSGGCCSLCTAGGEYGGAVSETGREDDYVYCDTLIAAASVYSDHPDYHEAWRA